MIEKLMEYELYRRGNFVVKLWPFMYVLFFVLALFVVDKVLM